MIIGIYTKIIYDYSELQAIENDLNITLSSNYKENTCQYASYYDRLYLLCLRNSNNFTTFTPAIQKKENNIEIWNIDSLSIDVEEIKSQNTDLYLYGTIFTIPKLINTKNINMNPITTIGSFIPDEATISKEQALDIARSIYSHWDLDDSKMICQIAYTYPETNYLVYDFNRKEGITTFRKIWKITSKEYYKDITILINSYTGEIINYY